jgi:hypothetical protein
MREAIHERAHASRRLLALHLIYQVAQTAGISTAWLYEHEAIKARIIHLRAQPAPTAKGQIPPREQASSASKDTMIATLQKRVREQAAEIEQLKQQVEVAYGLLAVQRKES